MFVDFFYNKLTIAILFCDVKLKHTKKLTTKTTKSKRTQNRSIAIYLWWCQEAEAQWKKEETGWNSTKKHKTP